MPMPMPDPASLIGALATIKAGYAALQVIVTLNDVHEALRKLRSVFQSSLKDPELTALASQIEKVIGSEIAGSIAGRLERCRTAYIETLNGGYMSREVDEGTRGFKNCMCRELRRLIEVYGALPPEYMALYELYGCKQK